MLSHYYLLLFVIVKLLDLRVYIPFVFLFFILYFFAVCFVYSVFCTALCVASPFVLSFSYFCASAPSTVTGWKHSTAVNKNTNNMLSGDRNRVAQWLKCCATNRKVSGSIPVGVTGFFIDIKSFRSQYGPGVHSAFNRNEYREYFLGGKKRPVRKADNLTAILCRCHEIWEP